MAYFWLFNNILYSPSPYLKVFLKPFGNWKCESGLNLENKSNNSRKSKH